MATLKAGKELKQRDLELFEERYNALEVDQMKGVSRSAGMVVRAALEAGWIVDLMPDGIGDMTAKDVRQLAQGVNQLYADLVLIDPNS